ncbi:hypothetical protein CP10139811_0690 [Chlamydia ibidis]|uniref:Uncharacterized protein n=3 Tax=Chlamydia ibidis TaxID=1405396 RepID=S7J3J4_9CHLA|nr:hypothetical protein CP10139811_0690 [Chlamydia ibidis]
MMLPVFICALLIGFALDSSQYFIVVGLILLSLVLVITCCTVFLWVCPHRNPGLEAGSNSIVSLT